MNKPWLGYVASALFLCAGIFMIVGNKILLGTLFIFLGIANTVINIFLLRKK